jgi:hypothetical protein
MENPSSERKFWEGPYPAEQAPLSDGKIQKTAERLKRDGYQFELTENSNEYVLRAEGFEGIAHITKVNDPGNVDIEDIIIRRITHPE